MLAAIANDMGDGDYKVRLKIMRNDFKEVQPQGQSVLGSRNSGKLVEKIHLRAIRYRGITMGASIGSGTLSPHDWMPSRMSVNWIYISAIAENPLNIIAADLIT